MYWKLALDSSTYVAIAWMCLLTLMAFVTGRWSYPLVGMVLWLVFLAGHILGSMRMEELKAELLHDPSKLRELADAIEDDWAGPEVHK